MGRRQFSTCYDHCSAGRRILNLCDYAWIPDVAVAVSRHSANLVTILVADACWHSTDQRVGCCRGLQCSRSGQ